jgi:carbonic anhydrase/acetyltransferase-like protein (isoleucine patch superfamily)
VHPTAYIAENATVVGDVRVGEGASIWFQAVVRADINRIVIGERSNIQDGSIVHVTKTHGVRIGCDVTVGHRAIVHGCTIEDESLVGMGAIVLDDARVCRASLVAAGAVVLEGFVVPEGSLAAGIPARIIRQLSNEEKAAIRQSAQNYVGYADYFRE